MKVGVRNTNFSPDAELIRALAKLLSETGLTEIEYAIGDRRIRVSRSAPPAVAHALQAFVAAPAAAPAADAALSPGTAGPARSLVDHPGAVKSPMVGTAFLAGEPGAPPFVRLGDTVAQGQPLLIIEAMKVMNQIRSPRAGTVARILIEDGAPVEYGAVLMVIE